MVFCIPTDTCYGIGCPLWDAASYMRIYETKKRPITKPLSLVLRNFRDLREWVDITDEQLDFLKKYSFPFTLLARKSDRCILPGFLDHTQYATLGIRIAERCIADEVSDRLTFPIFLTSANMSGNDEVYTSKECKRLFDHTFRGDDFIIDGTCERVPPSNIFSFVGNTLELSYTRHNYT